MYPGFLHRWKRHGRHRHGGRCHPGHGHHQERGEQERRYEAGSTFFRERRPLRFMAKSLDLEESQVKKLAIILDMLKTERAQAEVDDRRTVSAIAQAMDGDTFDAEATKEALELRVKTAERLRDAVFEALKETYAMLDDEQRERLAYLLRSGQLTI